MYRPHFFIALLILLAAQSFAQNTLHVGTGLAYANLSAAVAAVAPGDTIVMHVGVYPGGLFFNNLQGTPDAWITIRSAPGDSVVFQGGNNAIQLSDPAYLHLRGLIFQQQTANGFNTDDGGSYGTPAHHIVFEKCTFRNIAAAGNNDLLKLSGLDDFKILRCTLHNGAADGSGIDMVGCHRGLIQACFFENLGSNAIQAKGGTEDVQIERNFFRNGGQRTLNLGGSTGLAFFRPDTAHFEAANIRVSANIIVGSWAAVAYVGAVGVRAENNTIYNPGNWVIRILQETVDPDRFVECGDNTFRNNIVYLDHNLNTETNIGPNTRPETFVFSHNLWFNAALPNWSGPDIPTPDAAMVLNADPQFIAPATGNFRISAASPAVGAGSAPAGTVSDYYAQNYLTPPSIGAAEYYLASPTAEMDLPDGSLLVYPNPFRSSATVQFELAQGGYVSVQLLDGHGHLVREVLGRQFMSAGEQQVAVDGSGLALGVYTVQVRVGERVWGALLVRIE